MAWLGIPWAVACCLALAACDRGTVVNGQALASAEASARVSELLYDRGLIADAEVNRKMNEYVLAMSRDGFPPDSVMPAFARWLEAWARANPDRAAAARLAPRP